MRLMLAFKEQDQECYSTHGYMVNSDLLTTLSISSKEVVQT